MHIAIITAGGAGMYCGSCLHDNAWARGLLGEGVEVSLLPTYTPLTLDGPTIADPRVFLAGVNLYLDWKSKLWRAVPRGLKRWLDRPGVLKWASGRTVQTDARVLGDLTMAMLAGDRGPLRASFEELAAHVGRVLKPDVVILSNALLSGVLPALRTEFAGPVWCVLQGDDVFLDGLPSSYRTGAIDAVSALAATYAGIFVHSAFYRDYMAAYLRLPADLFHRLPLSIDCSEHTGAPRGRVGRQPVIGYFARIAPEKGLRQLVEAVALLRQRRPDVRLRVGGWLGPQHQPYFDAVAARCADWGPSFEYVGSPATIAEKAAFYQSVDVVSVPTEFLEPKGLYVLEALANGTPVVQPAHGVFPELLEQTGGGWLAPPRDPFLLAAALQDALEHDEERRRRAEQGQAAIRELHSPRALAAATVRELTRGSRSSCIAADFDGGAGAASTWRRGCSPGHHSGNLCGDGMTPDRSSR